MSVQACNYTETITCSTTLWWPFRNKKNGKMSCRNWLKISDDISLNLVVNYHKSLIRLSLFDYVLNIYSITFQMEILHFLLQQIHWKNIVIHSELKSFF